MLGPRAGKPCPKVDRSKLLARIDIHANEKGCWLWTGSNTGKTNYGRLKVQGTKFSAHRLVWENFVGPIPQGLTIDHLCRETLCVNPGHLDPVEPRVNTLRGRSIVARNAAKTTCALGHSFEPGQKGRYCYECYRAYQRRWRRENNAKHGVPLRPIRGPYGRRVA